MPASSEMATLRSSFDKQFDEHESARESSDLGHRIEVEKTRRTDSQVGVAFSFAVHEY
jgi:hypothetical protein